MRMSIDVIGRAMGRPARVADAVTAGARPVLQVTGKIGDTAGTFSEVEMVAGDRGQASTVITSVFETAQAFEKNRLGFTRADVANDAAPGEILSLEARERPPGDIPQKGAAAKVDF